MQRKIRGAHTTQKSPKISQTAPTAQNLACRTAFAPLAATTARERSRPVKRKVGVDLMGSSNEPPLLLKALAALAPELPDGVEIVPIGAPQYEEAAHPLRYVKAAQSIEMDEHPLLALRRKKDASICVGMRLLKEGAIDAFVSAGNTGALVSSAKMILSTLPGILRPSLLTLMPTKKSHVAVLDVGANIQAKESHLVQFAKLGVAFQKIRGIQNPRVGLLNIGSEAVKGTSQLKAAYHHLQKMKGFTFAGNIEGKTVFDGDVDVIVTDGFTGNIFLKTAEGIASLILDKIEKNSHEGERFQSLHYSEYPGALLAGVKGIAIKCHGYSSLKGFTNAVLGSLDLVKEGYVQKFMNELNCIK